AAWGNPFVLVEGNADLTPAKLVGHHNPARVLKEDYSAANFVPGPLIQAMETGGFLYIEELNRAPEDTLTTLLAAMAEREVALPRVGTVTAVATFRVLASMNPYDNVGTARISASVYDRWCRLALDYQPAEEEEAIVAVRTGSTDRRLIADAVALTRATRAHPDLRRGSSVRGAIDLVTIAETVKQVENLDRRIVARRADVRDHAGLKAAVDEGVSELGHLDVVCANAGILSFGPAWELTDEQWQDMIDINLTGVWHTLKATIPTLIKQGTGGSIILTSSVAGLKGFGYVGAYSAAKHGVVGLMRTLVNDVSP